MFIILFPVYKQLRSICNKQPFTVFGHCAQFLFPNVDRNAVKAFWQKAISAERIPEGRYTCTVILKRYGLINGDTVCK